MDKEEALRMIAANLARQRADLNDELWAEGKVAINLVQSPDDQPTVSSEYQTELQSFQAAFRDADIDAKSSGMALDSIESFGGQIEEFAIPIAKYGIPALSGIIVGWLKGRAGRKVRVEFFADGGPKKIEAQTPEEVISMFNAVSQEARTKPKTKRVN